MKVWVLEHFNLGSGTHPCGMWDGAPSVRQIMNATDLPASFAEMIILDTLDDYTLEEREVPKGEL